MNFKLKHQTHMETALKFILLICVFIGYLIYLVHENDLANGIITLALTWSFFVLCTPVADAGFLIDFPIRLLFGLRMLIVEIFVWTLALVIVIGTYLLAPDYYTTTLITRVLFKVITNPVPYWSIIILSFIGTFSSIFFGDEMLDVVTHDKRVHHHKHGFKYRSFVLLAVTILVVTVYYQLARELNVPISA